ncbi:MAG: glycosyltransferase family 39 protein [Planctomycetota bacterium]
MTRYRAAIVLLILAVAAGTALRARLIAAKRTLNHDEAISYLCAAGKQGLYREQSQAVTPPFGTWARAAELKQFLHPDEPLCFGRIGHDLAATDIHPPLYFWLLHGWVLAVGVHTWSGPALNTLLAAAAAVALFGLACIVVRDRLAAAAVAAIWVVSPAVIDTCFEARHYDLLALCGVGFTWAALRCVEAPARRRRPHPDHGAQLGHSTGEGESSGEPRLGRSFALPRWALAHRESVWLAVATLAGLLTHYHFVLLVAAAGAWLAVALRREPRRLLPLAAAVLAGSLAFVAVHPHFLASVLRAREQAQGFDIADLLPRLEATLLTYSTFFISTASNAWLIHKYLFPLGVAALVVATLTAWFLLRRRSTASAPSRSRLGSEGPGRSERTVVYFFLTMAGFNTALYLAGVSPQHAMGPQYLALVWPFLAFWPVLLLARLRPLVTPTLLLLCTAATATGAVGVQRQVARSAHAPDPHRFLSTAPVVVVDNVARGVLPCIAWHLADDQPVLAAPEAWLLEHVDGWTTRLAPGAIYVGVASYGNTPAGRERLLRTLSARHEVTPLDHGIFGVGRLHLLAGARARTPGGLGGHPGAFKSAPPGG